MVFHFSHSLLPPPPTTCCASATGGCIDICHSVCVAMLHVKCLHMKTAQFSRFEMDDKVYDVFRLNRVHSLDE